MMAISALLIVFCLAYASAEESCLEGDQEECCRRTLRPGQFYCTSPRLDVNTQSEVGCDRRTGLVNVSCFAAPLVNCSCENMPVVMYNMSQCIFRRKQSCRYVDGQRYDYRVAVALSLFLGLFGIDRFYLGYPAIGLLKLCTLGFFLIGHLIDFLLILIQTVGPADRTAYYIPFYGPLLREIGLFVETGSNETCPNT